MHFEFLPFIECKKMKIQIKCYLNKERLLNTVIDYAYALTLVGLAPN